MADQPLGRLLEEIAELGNDRFSHRAFGSSSFSFFVALSVLLLGLGLKVGDVVVVTRLGLTLPAIRAGWAGF